MYSANNKFDLGIIVLKAKAINFFYIFNKRPPPWNGTEMKSHILINRTDLGKRFHHIGYLVTFGYNNEFIEFGKQNNSSN